jgi:hypothetical protein
VRPLRCLFGLHSWEHCRCARCGSLRDREHDWEGSCTCAVCGRTRDADHQRVGCACRTCGTGLHDFVPTDSGEHSCRRCGLVEKHAFTSEFRWEDWGGWDSIGGWTAQENEYRVCRRCRHEEFAGFTGRIQI